MNGQATVGTEDDSEPDMELDDQLNGSEDWDKMETEEADTSAKYQDLLQDTVRYGQELHNEFKDDSSKIVKETFKDIWSFYAYENPRKSPVAHLLDRNGRVPVAEELNSAILGSHELRPSSERRLLIVAVSLGKSSSAAIERLVQQTEVLISDVSEEGGAGALINVGNDFL